MATAPSALVPLRLYTATMGTTRSQIVPVAGYGCLAVQLLPVSFTGTVALQQCVTGLAADMVNVCYVDLTDAARPLSVATLSLSGSSTKKLYQLPDPVGFFSVNVTVTSGSLDIWLSGAAV